MRAQGTPKRIAVVHPTEKPEGISIKGRRTFKAYFGELARQGYVEGHNLIVERYSALGRPEAYEGVARTIVESRPDVIVALSGPMARQLKPLTDKIPIVTATADPIIGRLVTSLARPEANITGVSVDSGVELNGKRLQLLHETVTRLRQVRLLVPATNLGLWRQSLQLMQAFADQAGISLDLAVLSGNIDKEAYVSVFESMANERVDGLIVQDGAENITFRHVIAELAAAHKLAAIYAYREAVEAGGLMSYGVDLADVLRRLADMTVQVLRGTKPSDIPFYQQTKFELILNRRAAIPLGIEFPSGLLLSADEVIE